MLNRLALFLVFFALSGTLAAQDTLPNFTVTTRGNNKVFISWTNPFPQATQISIQRSMDSIKGFRTLLSVPDPTIPQNGFVDAKPLTPYMFYRIFVVLDSGKYLFSPAKRPFWDTAKVVAIPKNAPEKNVTANNKRVIVSDALTEKEVEKLDQRIRESKTADTPAVVAGVKLPPPPPEPEKFITIKRRDSIITTINQKTLKAFRDSVIQKTKDTMVFRTVDTILIKPFVPKEVYRPSVFVFTDKEGNVNVNLPDAGNRKYTIEFMDEKSQPLFKINQVREPALIIDKANFLQAGWYRFELYEDGKLKEKNKFFIPKDF